MWFLVGSLVAGEQELRWSVHLIISLRLNKTSGKSLWGQVLKKRSDKECNTEPATHGYFRIMQEFGMHIVGFFSRPDSIITGTCSLHGSKLRLLGIINRHFRDKL